MSAVKPPFFFKWFNPEHLVCDLPGSDKVIYLTLDGGPGKGPIPEATPEVLGKQ